LHRTGEGALPGHRRGTHAERPIDHADRSAAVTPFPRWVWDLPARFNIAAACADVHAASAIAHRPAVIVDDAVRGVRQLDFAGLARATGRFAAVLEDLGVAAGERVLIRLANCLDYPIA